MLHLPRYLLGVAEILLLGGFAWLGASAVRARLVPDFRGAVAYLATAVVALVLLIWSAELLGSFGLFTRWHTSRLGRRSGWCFGGS